MMERFWSKVAKGGDDECWEWTASRDGCGYGSFRGRGAHRAAYELVVGPIPTGLELDHLCRNRACVNPAHLEPVTHAENMARGSRARKTHCPQGHPYDEENTIRGRDNRRHCRACLRAHRRRYEQRKAAA